MANPPMNLAIDLREVEAFTAVIGDVDRSIVAPEIRRTMRSSTDLFENSVIGRTPVNTGNARAATATRIYGTPYNIYHGEVVNPILYAHPLEEGRRPGKQPPRAAIRLWVIRKLGLSGREADSAAYLIARKIGQRGTRGAFMFKKGFRAARPAVLKLWDSVPARVVAGLLK